MLKHRGFVALSKRELGSWPRCLYTVSNNLTAECVILKVCGVHDSYSLRQADLPSLELDAQMRTTLILYLLHPSAGIARMSPQAWQHTTIFLEAHCALWSLSFTVLTPTLHNDSDSQTSQTLSSHYSFLRAT